MSKQTSALIQSIVNRLTTLLACTALAAAGCSSTGTRPGEVVGVSGTYNYSASVIQAGDTQQFWWCGGGDNPDGSGQYSDGIHYELINNRNHQSSRPVIVLAETAGSWDAAFTCNPRVIKGTFVNPLGDGRTWTYEMFYVGTANVSGTQNAIGAAFSNDGLAWTKYPNPVIATTAVYLYGVGQPAAYNRDGKSDIVLFYEDSYQGTHHVEAESSDGIHFTVKGTLTSNGINSDVAAPDWGDIGYDPTTGYWYATFELSVRNPSTTGGNIERGPYGFQLYRIPDSALLNGSTPWTMLKTVDTSLTGYESNFLPSLLHDGYGNIDTGALPAIQLFPSIATPPADWNASEADAGDAGDIGNWVIGSYRWTPGNALVALTRYVNADTYEVTTGWIDPGATFKVDAALGHLYDSPQGDANTALYSCKTGSSDYFVSLDRGCDSQHIVGLEGYGYARPAAGVQTVPLYRCSSPSLNHFVSHDPQCEGQGAGTLLAYGLP